LEEGGQIPPFLTTPALLETVKSLFSYASGVYQNKGIMEKYRSSKDISEIIHTKNSFLMTP
jgi:hypothetical protein